MQLRIAPRFADLLLVVVTLFWGTSFPLVKFLGDAVDPIVLMTYRFTFAAVFAGTYLIVKKRRLFRDLTAGLVTGVLLWLIFFPQMVGLRYTTASNSAFLTSLFVAFVPPFSFLVHRRKPSLEQGFAVILALCGSWFLTGGVASVNVGDLFTLGAAVSCGAYMVAVETFSRRSKDWFAFSFQQFCVVAILGFVQVLMTGLSFSLPDAGSVWITAYLSVVVTLIALAAQTWAQRHTSTIKAALIFVLEPVVAVLIAALWLEERFSAGQAVGAGLIFTALVVAALPIGRLFEARRRRFEGLISKGCDLSRETSSVEQLRKETCRE